MGGLLIGASLAFSQASVDVSDRFYARAQNWELRSLTTTLPQLRPYPAPVIQRVLNDVIENGTEADAACAKEEYERIFGRAWTPFVTATAGAKRSDEDADANYVRAEVGIGGTLTLHPLVSLGYKLGIYAESDEFSNYAPAYTTIDVDSLFDPAEVGPLTSYLDWNTLLSVGTASVYGSGGVSRVGFGPFHSDGLALNDSGYHSANLVFNATRDKWSYSSVYEIIGATRNMGREVDSNWLSGGKFLSFHAVKWHSLEHVQVSYYENIVFGPHNNVSYLFPAPYMALQNLNGASDNLQMGLLFEIKPFSGFEWATDFFADDIDVNSIFKGNLDSKNRFGFQTGVIYAPEDSLFSQISLNYTAIMPYVYAHWEYEDSQSAEFDGYTWNRQNYTNSGVNIGSVLDPNSDKISLKARMMPLRNLSIDFFGNFIRHANSAEDFSNDEAAEYMLAAMNTYATNGTLYMSQMFSSSGSNGKHVDSAWEKLGFMTSDHKMYVTQLGLNAEYTFARTRAGRFSLCAGYTFEYVKNAGVNNHVYKGGLTYTANDDGTYSDPDGNTYSTWEALKSSDYVQSAVKAARESWVANLYDCMNHYVSVSLKYSY